MTSKRPAKGMFITFEGIDGSGKTTQATRAYEALHKLGYDVLLTREPGGTDIGDQVRTILLDNMNNTAMHAHTELLLFCASRAQLVNEVIRPALAEGKIVLCDRYIDSTLAYQGYGRGLDLTAMKHILDFATDKLTPDMTVYLHLDPSSGLQRRQKRLFEGEEWNRLDALELAFHQRVYEGYETLMGENPKRWARIDGKGEQDDVQERMMQAIQKRLAQHDLHINTKAPSGS
jgi:dTMP kinase